MSSIIYGELESIDRAEKALRDIKEHIESPTDVKILKIGNFHSSEEDGRLFPVLYTGFSNNFNNNYMFPGSTMWNYGGVLNMNRDSYDFNEAYLKENTVVKIVAEKKDEKSVISYLRSSGATDVRVRNS